MQPRLLQQGGCAVLAAASRPLQRGWLNAPCPAACCRRRRAKGYGQPAAMVNQLGQPQVVG